MSQNFKPNFSDLGIYDTLMLRRIHKILLVCSSYDAFILEQDGRIDDLILKEYTSLNLRFPPIIKIVNTAKCAFDILENEQIDLIIAMPSISDYDVFEFSKKVKSHYPNVFMILLTPFSRDISLRLEKENKEYFDYIFSWLGNPDILIAIIKLVEDQMNADNDFKIGVQYILLVEDSVRYFSSFLPIMYKILLQHNPDIEANALNEHHKMIRKRGRPKILMANNFNKAIDIVQKYPKNLLGVISDVSFPKDGRKVQGAGFLLVEFLRERFFDLPILLQSSDIANKELAERLNITFVDKNSPDLLYKIRDFIRKYLALGDFVFINPENGQEIKRAKDLYEMQKVIFDVPDNSLVYHLSRNHLSRWLNTRAIFNLGNYLREYQIDQFESLDDIRHFVKNSIAEFLLAESRGIIARFSKENYDEYISFAQIGSGVIGGKARGLLFLDLLISKYNLDKKWENIDISTPRTVVIGSGVFDEFMETNNLYEFVFDENISDEQILKKFIDSTFPMQYVEDLIYLLEFFKRPVAVRSSSLLEDSYYQPYAGIYNTYMLPFRENIQNNLNMLIKAIKSVWASVFFGESKAYSKVTQNLLDEEKMAVVIQPICGDYYNNRYYPIISGVAKSFNYYPIGNEKPEDGIVEIALGLGKQIVEGGLSLRFVPSNPQNIFQLSDNKLALTHTQKDFYAIDMTIESFEPSVDERVTLKKFSLADAEKDGTLNYVCSVYNYDNDTIYDGFHYEGKKIITFSNILKYNQFPLAEILDTILKIGQKEMGHPVEIEFAVNYNFRKSPIVNFRLLQIRPIVEMKQIVNIKDSDLNPQNAIVISYSAMGNGIIDDVKNIVYVRPQNFDSIYNLKIKEIIANINSQIEALGENYLLIGPGRWGSRDHWLGIPVKWSQISAARVIVEASLPNYVIEPSQGTHFFQNITALRVAYFNVNPHFGDGIYDVDYLDSLAAQYEDTFVRWIRLDSPLVIKVDGKKRIGIVFKK